HTGQDSPRSCPGLDPQSVPNPMLSPSSIRMPQPARGFGTGQSAILPQTLRNWPRTLVPTTAPDCQLALSSSSTTAGVPDLSAPPRPQATAHTATSSPSTPWTWKNSTSPKMLLTHSSGSTATATHWAVQPCPFTESSRTNKPLAPGRQLD